MSRKLKRLCLTLCFVIAIAIGMSTNAYAGSGSSMTDPINVTFGQQYSASWNEGNLDLIYHKVVLKEKGILKFEFSKPLNYNGSLDFILYDANKNGFWDSSSFNASIMGAATYTHNIGLNAGTYYVAARPNSYLFDNPVIKSNYTFSFQPSKYIEVEPNETAAQATELKFGSFYTGFYGSDSGYNYGNNDFFKFKLKKGSSYRLYLDNYDGLKSTSCIIDIHAPNGTKVNTFDSFWQITSSGQRYIEFIAPASGYYHFQLWNHRGLPIKYRVKIAHALKPAATAIASGYNFSKFSKELSVELKQQANIAGYEIQYSTNKAKISKGKIKRVSGADNVYVNMKGVKSSNSYYLRVRTYKYINGVKKTSAWSKVKVLKS